MTFRQIAIGGSGYNEITVQAAQAVLDPTSAPYEALSFTGAGGSGGGAETETRPDTGASPATANAAASVSAETETKPETSAGTEPRATAPPGGGGGQVRVEQRIGGKLTTAYTCDAADLVLSMDQYMGTGVNVGLRLHGNVMRENHEQAGLKPVSVGTQSVASLLLDPALAVVPPIPPGRKADLVAYAAGSPRQDVRKLGLTASGQVTKLFQTIDSELHSRGSFSLSCLTLVLLGAALGILLRGKNPLAVFVVGFVPAIILVLLITAGRQLTEGNPKNVLSGIIMIWAGNGVLLAIVAAVYARLLRR